MPYIVKYRESEQGWGSETWFRGFEDSQKALAEVEDVNSKNTSKTAPTTYIQAEYQGFSETVPEGYKN